MVARFIKYRSLQLYSHLLHWLEPQQRSKELAHVLLMLLEVGEALGGLGVEGEDAVAGSQG